MENQLSIIQAKVKAPKGQFNSFGKYHYRSAEDILEAVKKVVNPMGFSITLTDDIIFADGRWYIKSIAELTNGKETFSSVGLAREEETKKGMDGSQITGAASSYARKYALNGLFALDDTKDSDATNTHGKEAQKQAVSISAVELGEVKRLLDECQTMETLKEIWDDIEDQYQVLPIIKELFTNRKKQLSK